MKQNNWGNSEVKLDNWSDLIYFKKELTNTLKTTLWLIYNAFKDLKWKDAILISYLLHITKEENFKELDIFINKTSWFSKKRLLEIVEELKIILPDIISNKKYLEYLLNNVNKIEIKNWELYREYCIWKWSFTVITINIYDFLIKKINESYNLDDIYKLYEKIRGVNIKENKERANVEIKRKEFLSIFWSKKKKI